MAVLLLAHLEGRAARSLRAAEPAEPAPTTLPAALTTRSSLFRQLPVGPALPSRHFSGWLPVAGGRRRLFYVFGEASESPESKPLIFWMNGGPGCSSVGLGFWQANGPFVPVSNASQLLPNPFAWTKALGNMLWLEQPAFTGFSTSSDEADRSSNDAQAVADMLAFLLQFYTEFPGMRANKLVLVGVSYAGHYGPQLARAILAHNKAAHPASRINLGGLAMGNAWTSSLHDNTGTLDKWYGMGLISRATYDGLLACDLARGALWRTDGPSGFSPACEALRNQAYAEASHEQLLGLNAPSCVAANLSGRAYPKLDFGFNGWPIADPCASRLAVPLMNDRSMQLALKVIGPGEPTRPWVPCAGRNLTWSTTDLVASMVPVYRELLAQGLPILVYTGDQDSYVPVGGTRAWLEEMALPLLNASRPIRTWWDAATQQIGGHTVEYAGGLTWATIRGAGHAASSYQPLKTIQVLRAFLQGERLAEEPAAAWW